MHDLPFDAPWLASRLVPGSTWYFQFAYERHAGARRIEEIPHAPSLTLE